MCILFVYINPCPVTDKYRLILATNRDEHFVRNAQPLKKWLEDPIIISGLDLEPGREGGTWLGLSSGQIDNQSTIRIGALLNITGEPRINGAAGRGFIVSDYLKQMDISTDKYINSLKMKHKSYNSFNFVAIEVNKCNIKTIHYSNVSNDVITFEGEAVLGFGNSLPDRPLTKVIEGQNRFNDIVKKYGDVNQVEQLKKELIEMLKWKKKQLPDQELQRRAPDFFEHLSSVYVHIPQVNYGTRTHTIILIDWNGNVDYDEHTMECPINPDDVKWIQSQVKARL